MSSISQPNRPTPYVLTRGEAPALWLVATLWLPLASGAQTGNRFILIEQEFAAGPGPVAHVHPYDEAFYVLEGQFTYHAGGQVVPAGPGTFVHIPRFTQHGFLVDQAPARALNFYPASGFELLLMSLAHPAAERRIPTMAEGPLPPPEQVEILAKLYGMERVQGMPFIDPYSPAAMATAPPAWSPSAVLATHAATAPAYAALGSRWTVLADATQTAGAYSVLLRTLPAGSRVPAQVHTQDEGLYVLSGTLRLQLDDQQLTAPAESFAYLPAGTVQTLAADDEVQLLVFYVPGGFEQGIRDFGAALTGAAPPAPGYATPADKAADLTKFLTQYGVREVGQSRPPRPA